MLVGYVPKNDLGVLLLHKLFMWAMDRSVDKVCLLRLYYVL